MSLNNMEHLKINARTQVQEEEDEKERTLSLLQDNETVKRSAAESKALMRRIYSKIDKDTTRDEMLKIMEMPQSGWFIEKVRCVCVCVVFEREAREFQSNHFILLSRQYPFKTLKIHAYHSFCSTRKLLVSQSHLSKE